MKKILTSNILALIMLIATIAVGFTVGLTAASNKSLEFNVGIKYDPEIKVAVEINETLIFDSHDISNVNYQAPYISSMTSDTINLVKGTVASQGEEITLTFYNYNDKAISIYVCDSETPISILPMTESGATTGTTTLQPAEIGALVISLRFEFAEMFTLTFINTATEANIGTSISNSKWGPRGYSVILDQNEDGIADGETYEIPAGVEEETKVTITTTFIANTTIRFIVNGIFCYRSSGANNYNTENLIIDVDKSSSSNDRGCCNGKTKYIIVAQITGNATWSIEGYLCGNPC